MPYCAILECKNDSRAKNLSNGGVSYHRFPKEAKRKEDWLNATGRIKWFPVKSSTICSEHFLEEDFIISIKGYRYLKATAVPTIKIVTFFDQIQNPRENPGPSKRQATSTNIECESKTPKKKRRPLKIKTSEEEHASESSVCSTPKKQKLKGQLRWSNDKIKQKNLIIRRLQAQNRKLKIKIKNIEQILKTLEEKFTMTQENLDSLKNTNLEIDELIARKIGNTESGVVSRKKYSQALRSFALTLHYYSPKAYDYVRQKFNTSLPHIRTLKYWYSKVGGEPGFTKESFIALKQKADSSNSPIVATLVIDEISIRRRIEWDGHKFHGYIDMGTGLDGDHLAEAKEALVFLITAINRNFKVPVAYFLVDGVSGQQRAHLVSQCLELAHEAGIMIVALTFDGCAANLAMARHLGCCFDKQEICFKHPSTKSDIVAILDPSHMIKLLRNAFENYKVILDNDGNKIKWQHIINLNKLQYDETFHLSNKLRDRHVNFQKERMKVKLATQLFSLSIADALKFCRNSGIETFSDSEPTEKFLIICNNLFDVFNSRSLHLYGYKKALNEINANIVFEFLEQTSEYIRHLKTENEILLINSSRKTGFIGFLSCIEAIKHLYISLVESKILVCLPFYKMSQDHLELFFCNIRAQGGTNNNPTARQFVSAYKKILVHVELKNNSSGNCSALENISILNCSSAVDRINKSTGQGEPVEIEMDQEIEMEELGDFFSEFSNQAIGHIAGYIVRILLKKINCSICVNALVTHHFEYCHKFIIAKDRGGLLYPSLDVIRICQTSEIFLKNLISTGFKKEALHAKILSQFVGTNLFDGIAYHQLGEFPASNHVTDLIKCIVEKYVNVRIHHLLRLNIKLSKRQFFNKYVLFQGQ